MKSSIRQLLKSKYVIPALLIIVMLVFIIYIQNQGPNRIQPAVGFSNGMGVFASVKIRRTGMD